MAQRVERLTDKCKVLSSNPNIANNNNNNAEAGDLAEVVEHLPWK
jgi:hypothetical protein